MAATTQVAGADRVIGSAQLNNGPHAPVQRQKPLDCELELIDVLHQDHVGKHFFEPRLGLRAGDQRCLVPELGLDDANAARSTGRRSSHRAPTPAGAGVAPARF